MRPILTLSAAFLALIAQVVDCLKDSDISIRRRALDLIYALVTKNNVKALVKELLNYLALTTGDTEFKSDLTEKICLVVERFAPSKQWHIDTIISVLATAGGLTRESVATDLILLIARTPNLQAYATYKLFYALYNAINKKGANNLMQSPTSPSSSTAVSAAVAAAVAANASNSHALTNVAVWCIGEYGDMLVSAEGLEQARAIDNAASAPTTTGAAGDADAHEPLQQVSESMVLDLLTRVQKAPGTSAATRMYLLNALLKLSGRLASTAAGSQSTEMQRLKALIATHSTSMNLELQQRAVEYSTLLGDDLANIRKGVVGRMPVPTKKKKGEAEGAGAAAAGAATKKKGDESDESESESESGSESESEEEDEATARARAAVPVGNGVKKTAAAPAPTPSPAIDLFGGIDLLGGGGGAATTATSPPATASTASQPAAAAKPLDLLDLFGGGGSVAAPVAQPAAAAIAGGLQDLFGLGPATATKAASPSPAAPSTIDLFGSTTAPAASPSTGMQTFPPEIVYDSNGLQVQFSYSRSASTPDTLHVTAAFSNSNNSDLTNFDFQVAVLKHVQLQMQPASSTTIPAHSHNSVTQSLTLHNTLHGKKKIVIRVKIDYRKDGVACSETAQIAKFPE